MRKSDFTTLKKVLKKAENVYVQSVSGHYGDQILLAEGHFIVWMPINIYETYMCNDPFFPVVPVNNSLTHKEGVWKEGCPDISGLLDSLNELENAKGMVSVHDTGFCFEVDYEMLAWLFEAKEIVRLNIKYRKMAYDLCGTTARKLGTDHMSPIWFYNRDVESMGCMILPCNYNINAQEAQIERLLQAAKGEKCEKRELPYQNVA